MRTIVLILVLLATNARAQDDKSKEVEKRCAEISAEIEKFLGAKFKKKVPVSVRDLAFFKDFTRKTIRAQTTDEEREVIRLLWERMRILPKGFDFENKLVEFVAGQFVGLYDPETKQFYVRDSVAKSTGVRFVTTAAHELIHAYRDERTDFYARTRAAAASDEDWAAAVRCLAEGDASLLGMGLGTSLSQAGTPGGRLRALLPMLKEPEAVDAMLETNVPGMPRALQELLVVAYREGLVFAAHVYEKGGLGALEGAFKNPPRSTEQVLHPQKFLGPDVDEPTIFFGGDPAPVLGDGWTSRRRGTLGEFDIRVLLLERLGRADAATAAEGWDGIRYHFVTHTDGRSFLGLMSTWDSARDAKEFARAWLKWASLRDGAKAKIDADRVGTRDGLVSVRLKGRDVIVADGVPGRAEEEVLRALGVAGRRERRADEKPPAGE